MSDDQLDEAPSDAPARFDTPPTPASPPPSAPVHVDTGYTPDGVPTFESVREKIETRYGTAQGAGELDADTATARNVEQQYEARQKAAAERLEQIRKSMQQPKGDS